MTLAQYEKLKRFAIKGTGSRFGSVKSAEDFFHDCLTHCLEADKEITTFKVWRYVEIRSKRFYKRERNKREIWGVK